MYLLDTLDNAPDFPLAMTSLSKPTSLKQWHQRLTHCSPLTIQDMAKNKLVDGLTISELSITGKCEDCIVGRQTRRPFDGTTEKDLAPLDLVAFDLWGPSRTQSVRGKVYLMIIINAGTSYKYGAYLSDKSDTTVIPTFKNFRTRAETVTGRKIHRLQTDRAFESSAWGEYCQRHGITHEFTAPYLSAQNGLAERAIRTTIDDVRTLLRDSNLGHSYWAEAAAYSIDARNLIPSRQHPGHIPTESFTGKRQSGAHLRVFGSRCWAKTPTAYGDSKLDPWSTECRLLGYASGSGNYKVQDVATRRVFVSRDVVFEEGQARRMSANAGEQTQIPLFDVSADDDAPANVGPVPAINDVRQTSNQPVVGQIDHQRDSTSEPRRSTRTPQPSQAKLRSSEYKTRESTEKGEGQDWATDRRPRASSTIDWSTNECEDFIACLLTETKASHHIPRSYRHAMTTDPDRWMIPMQIEMETLRSKHTWDLVKSPPGANIMGSMWIYDIKWDGEGN